VQRSNDRFDSHDKLQTARYTLPCEFVSFPSVYHGRVIRGQMAFVFPVALGQRWLGTALGFCAVSPENRICRSGTFESKRIECTTYS